MNWINNVVRPKIQGLLNKREVPEKLWIKCPDTGEMVFHRDLEANNWVVPSSGHHMRMPCRKRLDMILGAGAWVQIETPEVPVDPLKFRDERRYTDRLRDAKAKTELEDAVLVARGAIDEIGVICAVQEFDFMGGSLGMAAAEAIITGADLARAEKKPFILFAASGGARMQEGILSLMQMPRTTVAVSALKEAGLPYIVVLTNPTTGGVTASYAMLGDIQIAEPGALIGFAGPRVIEQTIREKLPVGFQRAEYLFEHGMVDMVVERSALRETLLKICRILLGYPARAEIAEAVPATPEEPVETPDEADGVADTVKAEEAPESKKKDPAPEPAEAAESKAAE